MFCVFSTPPVHMNRHLRKKDGKEREKKEKKRRIFLLFFLTNGLASNMRESVWNRKRFERESARLHARTDKQDKRQRTRTTHTIKDDDEPTQNEGNHGSRTKLQTFGPLEYVKRNEGKRGKKSQVRFLILFLFFFVEKSWPCTIEKEKTSIEAHYKDWTDGSCKWKQKALYILTGKMNSFGQFGNRVGKKRR